MATAKSKLDIEVSGDDQVRAALGRAANAVKQWDKQVSMNIKKLALWSIGARTTFRVFMQVRGWLKDSYDALYENTEQTEALSDATSRLGRSLVMAAEDGLAWLAFVDNVTRDLEKLSRQIDEAVAAKAGLAAMGEVAFAEGELGPEWLVDIYRTLPGPTLIGLTEAVLAGLGITVGDTGRQAETATAYFEAYTAKIRETEAAHERATESTDEYADRLKELQQATKRLTDMSMRHTDIMEDFTEGIHEAGLAFKEDLIDAQEEYEDDVKKAETRAFKDRERAWKDYYKRLNKIQQDQQDQTSNLEERHRLQMEFAERRHVLNLLNSEALYQYERGRLVAEGDVLAIEDLDARYELERQATEENFRLQQQQAEAMFQLQLRQQQQAMERQREDLWAALQERLHDVEEARRERLQEAVKDREEAKIEAKERYQEEMDDQKKALAKRLEDQVEFWAKYLMDMGIGFGEAQKIIQAQFGAGSPSERYFTDFWTRRQLEMIRYTQMLASTMGLAYSRTMGGLLKEGVVGGGYQYGGSFIANRPTSIMVGEGYSPERVTVQPLSSIGGTLTVRWQGGAIPVHGTGSLSGADMSGAGQAIAQGLVTEIRTAISSYRGQRGG